MNTYRKIAVRKRTFPISETVKVRLTGLTIAALGVLSALLSEYNGVYDITAALLLVPVGVFMLIAKP